MEKEEKLPQKKKEQKTVWGGRQAKNGQKRRLSLKGKNQIIKAANVSQMIDLSYLN